MRKRPWFQKLLLQRIVVIVMLVAQVLFLVYTIGSNSRHSQVLTITLTIISVLTAFHLLRRKDKGAFKLSLVFLILLFPLFGGLFYWMFSAQMSSRGFSKKLREIELQGTDAFLLGGDHYDYAEAVAPNHRAQIYYLQKFAGFPIYKNTKTNYFPSGEKKMERLLFELEKAEHYIFLEYFIIDEGIFWDSILEILKRKAAAGVEVRIIYDDVGCFLLLPKKYYLKLREFGIECAVFNPFRPFLTVVQNNRDHRKILVIDGKVAFTGGVNLADEYVNQKLRFGHWKDAAVMLDGEAAWSFTVMFLQMWNFLKNEDPNYDKYFPNYQNEDDGLVQPYADSPMDRENIGEHVYLQMIDQAQDYLYITTPYLMLDESMISALCLAAKSGVDVRIITPHVPDKKLVLFTTRSYYQELISSGIRIYEYHNGFIHSKTFVSDDITGTVGTTNVDFRSLYLHFECGAWFYKSSVVMDLKKDFLKTLSICDEITEADCKRGFLVRLWQDILRLFAPLM